MMKLLLEQLFYGRGGRGYGVLGMSPGGAPFAARVEKLCGAVGTPGADYGGEPFLLSVPEGDCVLMVCGRRGAPDSMNRETLFFHAIVAARKDLAAAKGDAFSLFAQGAFAAKMPAGTVEPLRIDCKSDRDGSASRPSNGRATGASMPCFVRSSSPAPGVVRAFVGARANDLAWATFAFQPLDGFDVQILPPRIASPRSVNECDADGKLVRAAEMSGGRAAPARSASLPYHHDTPKQTPSSSKQSSTMLKISLFANVALAVVCAALLSSRGSGSVVKPEPSIVTDIPKRTGVKPEPSIITDSPEQSGEISLSDERKAEIEGAAVKRYLDALAAKLPPSSRIKNFKTEKETLPQIDDIKSDPKFATQLKFLERLESYVSFVNDNILVNNANTTESIQ